MPARWPFVKVGTGVSQFDAVKNVLVDWASMHLANHRYLSKGGCRCLPYGNDALVVNFSSSPEVKPQPVSTISHQVQTTFSSTVSQIWNSILNSHRQSGFQHTFTAYFLCGKCVDFFFCFSVIIFPSCLLNRLLIALVCLGRRSRGKYFFFA